MRTDVKLGVVLSLVVVLVGGGYFLARDKDREAVPLGSGALTGETLDASADGDSGLPAVSPAVDPLDTEAKRVAEASPTQRPGLSTRLEVGSPKVPGTRTARPSPGNRSAIADRGSSEIVSDTGRAKNRASRMERPRGRRSGSRNQRPLVGDNRKSNRPAKPAAVESPIPRKPTDREDVPPSAAAVPGSRKSLPQPKAASSASERHRVQPGDTFESLALAYYGHGRFSRIIMAANPQVSDPTKLRVGITVQIPPAPKEGVKGLPPAPPKAPVAKPPESGRTYVVKRGDTFYAIARDVLGDAARWPELLALNKSAVGGDPKRLRPGQVLDLP